jgi:hypothetical protein
MTYRNYEKRLPDSSDLRFTIVCFLLAIRQPLYAISVGWRLALNWLCFSRLAATTYYHNPFSVKHLHSFKLLKMGFVFSNDYQIHSLFLRYFGLI